MIRAQIAGYVAAIVATGHVEQDTAVYGASLDWLIYATSDETMRAPVHIPALAALIAAHPSLVTLDPDSREWACACLDVRADGWPGTPGMGDARAAAYTVAAAQIADDDGTLLPQAVETVALWLVERDQRGADA